VPDWVITSPTIDRIKEENNVEVRRCAIERIGWDPYIDQAGLHLVAAVADPGNPGCDLCLYDMPAGRGACPTGCCWPSTARPSATAAAAGTA